MTDRILKNIFLFIMILGAGMIIYPNTKRIFAQAEIQEQILGEGKVASRGDEIIFHYQARLVDENHSEDTPVDSSYRRRQPQKITLGAKQFPPGVEEALIGMQAGGKKKIRVPAHLAYGKSGAAGGLIPANSDLIYSLEMKRVF